MHKRKNEVEYAAVLKSVQAALTELNNEIDRPDEGFIRSFYIEYDNDVDGWAANLIWSVGELPEAVIDESSELDEPDLLLDLCTLGANKLQGIVSITYCDYRTKEEYQSYYGAARWESQLVELPDVA